MKKILATIATLVVALGTVSAQDLGAVTSCKQNIRKMRI